MDADRFDTLSKTVVSGLGRRRMLAALLSGALTALVGRQATEAGSKPRHTGHPQTQERQQAGGAASGHRAAAKRKRTPQAGRKAHNQPQAEGRRKGKKRHKKPSAPPPPLPP